MIPVLATAVGACLCSAFLTDLIRKVLLRRGVMDLPSDRGLHAEPVVRGAGLAFAITWLLVTVVIAIWDGGATVGLGALILTATALTALGLWDDVAHINALYRLLGQALICSVAVAGGVRITTLAVPGTNRIALGMWAVPICVVGLMAMANLFNFMDGIDGLTAGQTIVSSAAVAGAAVIAHATAIGLVAATLAGAVAGFLPFNWSPARCFMGDAGSYFCGGTLGGVLLLSDSHGIPLTVVGLASAAFLLDGSVTLLRRLIRHRCVWEPHREHVYQRLVLRGWPHAGVAMLYIAVGCALGGIGLVYFAGAWPAI